MAGEVVTQDLRRNSVTWKWFDVAAFANLLAPTVAELNTANENLGLDITCALDEEGTSFTLGSSDTDDRLSFCDGVGVARPTSINPELTLALYRDKDRAATGVFNKALDRFKHVDQTFVLVQRVGPQDSGPRDGVAAKAFATTDLIRVARFVTDYPVDTLGNEDPAMITVVPFEDGALLWNGNPSA